jgi:DNA-binding transcriptional LysR family regulator
MPSFKDLDSVVGRRLRMRDLHVFMAVVQARSMARAALQLGVSQPAVSEVIGSLEHALRVRLFDRKPQGVELTQYGEALLQRTRNAFDEFKQALRDIEGLADPTAGKVRIGCPESIIGGILPPILEGFGRQYPRAVVEVEHITTPTLELPQLRERKLDLALARMPRDAKIFGDDLDLEILFDDHLIVAAGLHTRWAGRRRIDLAELLDEPWILTPENAWNTTVIADALAPRGLKMPNVAVVTYSVQLRANLLATGPYITTFPNSVLAFAADRYSVKILPVELPPRPWPVVAVTLKHRTLSPIVRRFIDLARASTRSINPLRKPGASARAPLAKR